MFTRRIISLNDLLLDVDNSRFADSVDSQREAIKVMVESQGQKIIKLAKDIAEFGIDPSENLITVSSEENENDFIVKEGNRRITALKLIENPSLAQIPSVITAFENIRKSRKESINEVNCVVYDNDEFSHWINLKHTGQNDGAGRVGWTTPEQLRYMARNGKESFSNQLYSFIELFPDYFSNIINNKKYIRITNLDRLVNDPNFRKCLNLTGIEGLLYCSQPLSRFLEQYNRVLESMIMAEENGRAIFTVNRIRSKEDRLNFISELQLTSAQNQLDTAWRLLEPPKLDEIPPEKETERKEPKEGSHTDKDDSDDTAKDDDGYNTGDEPDTKDGSDTTEEDDKSKGKKSSPTNNSRNILVPVSLKLKFDKQHKRCHKIFNELKKMTHDDFSNSISVMLRVFVELSLNTYIEENKLKYFDKKNPNRTPGLHDKVVLASDDLFKKNLLSGQKKTAILAYSKQFTSAGASLQQYVHNPELIPTREFVNNEWDNFQNLMEAIWA
jgi:hypothetical protein